MFDEDLRFYASCEDLKFENGNEYEALMVFVSQKMWTTTSGKSQNGTRFAFTNMAPYLAWKIYLLFERWRGIFYLLFVICCDIYYIRLALLSSFSCSWLMLLKKSKRRLIKFWEDTLLFRLNIPYKNTVCTSCFSYTFKFKLIIELECFRLARQFD